MKNLIKITLLTSLIILAITGCTNNAPIKSNPNVPKVSQIRSLSDRNAIALEWDMVNKPQIAGYYIERSDDAKKYKLIATIDSKYITHYTDTNLKPNHIYFYKISTFTKNKIPSFAKLIKVQTLAKMEPLPFVANDNLKVRGMIKLVFRPHPNERVKGYYIQRFNDKNGKWENIANLQPRLRAEYIDKNLIDGKIYQYRIIAYSFDNIKSYPSKILKIKTLQKPQMITNITATTNLPKMIKISWQPIKGVIKYKIYYSDYKNGNYKLLAQTKDNYYTDNINKDGYTRYYKIASVDKYSIESIKSQPVMGSTLNIPAKPIVSIEKNKKSITFILSSPDKRAVKYLIKKIFDDKVIKIHNVPANWTDEDIKLNKTYKYEIYAIDKNGLISKPSEVEVSF